MNQNDMDRYLWRTGHQWSGDSRSLKRRHRPPLRLSGWAVLVLVVAYLLTTILMIGNRLHYRAL